MNFKEKIVGWFMHNFWMKVFALVLAIITWLYVNGEIGGVIRF